MKIIDEKNNVRILIKDDNSEINISDGQFIKYTGIYYKNSTNLEDIETSFYGIIECCRYRYDLGTTGIYIKPLYIFLNNEWYKIINYINPTNKYFLYPHLLMLPNIYHYYKPLYFLDTIENVVNFLENKDKNWNTCASYSIFSEAYAKENIYLLTEKTVTLE